MSRPPLESDEDLARVRAAGERVGLCARCVHVAAAASSRSLFVRCRRAAADPRFPRYPVLPVLACRGFEESP